MNQTVPVVQGVRRDVRTLTEAQERAVALLTCGQSFSEVGKAIGCSARAVESWTKQPDFASACRAAQRALTEHIIREATRNALTAGRTVSALLEDTRPSIRLGAARLAYDVLKWGVEHSLTHERFAAIEEALAALSSGIIDQPPALPPAQSDSPPSDIPDVDWPDWSSPT